MKLSIASFLVAATATITGVDGQVVQSGGQYTFRCDKMIYHCGKKIVGDNQCLASAGTTTVKGTTAECNLMKGNLKVKGYPGVFTTKCPNAKLMTQFVQYNTRGTQGKKFDKHGVTKCKGAHCGGDPHFLTYDGEGYSYHGQCDLVMARSSDINDSGFALDIHSRTKMIADWSYMSNAAIRIGTDILEITSNGTHYLNGQPDVPFPILMMGHFNVTRVEKEVFPGQYRTDYRIDLEHVSEDNGEDEIRISAFKDMLSINVDAMLPDTHGMLGMMARSGMYGRDLVTQIEDVYVMGQEWQVRSDEPMLFVETDVFPQYPSKCLIPPTNVGRKLLRHTDEQIRTANEACANVYDEMMQQFCIEDILLTNDHEYAGMYHGH